MLSNLIKTATLSLSIAIAITAVASFSPGIALLCTLAVGVNLWFYARS